MKTYRVTVRRTEEWVHTVEMESELLRDEFKKHVQDRLDTEGWDAVCNAQDGDYDHCSSEVERVTLVEEDDDAEDDPAE